MKPTRIVHEFYVCRGKFRTKTRMLMCDNGRIYPSVKRLATEVLLAPSTLARRIDANGATHADNLKPVGELSTSVPDEERMCEWCGEVFTCRPRSKQRFCGPSCGRKGRVIERSSELDAIPDVVRGGVNKIKVGTWEATL